MSRSVPDEYSLKKARVFVRFLEELFGHVAATKGHAQANM